MSDIWKMLRLFLLIKTYRLRVYIFHRKGLHEYQWRKIFKELGRCYFDYCSFNEDGNCHNPIYYDTQFQDREVYGCCESLEFKICGTFLPSSSEEVMLNKYSKRIREQLKRI